jgi:hypothetical protein
MGEISVTVAAFGTNNSLLAGFAESVFRSATNRFVTDRQRDRTDPAGEVVYQRSFERPAGALQAMSEVTRVSLVDVPRWAGYVRERLTDLRLAAYDFTGLQVPAEWLVDRAWLVANSYLSPATIPPSIVPSSEGNVLFIWHKAGWDVEIEISPEGTSAWAYNQRSGEEWSGSLDERQTELKELLGVLSRT